MKGHLTQAQMVPLMGMSLSGYRGDGNKGSAASADLRKLCCG